MHSSSVSVGPGGGAGTAAASLWVGALTTDGATGAVPAGAATCSFAVGSGFAASVSVIGVCAREEAQSTRARARQRRWRDGIGETREAYVDNTEKTEELR